MTRLLSRPHRALPTVVFSITAALLPLPCRAQYVSSFTISTLAGTGVSGYSGDGGAAEIAQLAGPVSIAVDASGKVYIADQLNHRIRMVTPAGTISTFAGTGTAGYAGDGAAATSAELYSPSGIAVDSSGNVFFADSRNHLVRKIGTGGTITTVAGSYLRGPGFSGDGGPRRTLN